MFVWLGRWPWSNRLVEAMATCLAGMAAGSRKVQDRKGQLCHFAAAMVYATGVSMQLSRTFSAACATARADSYVLCRGAAHTEARGIIQREAGAELPVRLRPCTERFLAFFRQVHNAGSRCSGGTSAGLFWGRNAGLVWARKIVLKWFSFGNSLEEGPILGPHCGPVLGPQIR